MQTVVPSHITIDERGIARIDGTPLKVIHLIEAMKAWFPTPEALCAAYPQLTRSQIHAALAYYYDHQAQIDGEIERRLEQFDHLSEVEESPLRRKLRELGQRS